MVTSQADVGRTYEEAGRKRADHEKFQNTAKVNVSGFLDIFFISTKGV